MFGPQLPHCKTWDKMPIDDFSHGGIKANIGLAEWKNLTGWGKQKVRPLIFSSIRWLISVLLINGDVGVASMHNGTISSFGKSL